MADDLCSIVDVRAWLKLDDDATSEDALLTRLISAESTRIYQYLHKPKLLAANYELIFCGNGKQVEFFAQSPINSVASVAIGNANILASSLGSAGFLARNDKISLIGYRFTRGIDNIRVVLNAGYADLPADISQAAIELVCFRYLERGRIGHASKSLGSETVSYITKEMPDSVAGKLTPYRRITPALWSR